MGNICNTPLSNEPEPNEFNIEDKIITSKSKALELQPNDEINEPISFIGKTIGRRIMGKKCIFIDMVICDRPNSVITADELAAGVRRDIHGTGDQVAREKRLQIEDIVND